MKNIILQKIIFKPQYQLLALSSNHVMRLISNLVLEGHMTLSSFINFSTDIALHKKLINRHL